MASAPFITRFIDQLLELGNVSLHQMEAPVQGRAGRYMLWIELFTRMLISLTSADISVGSQQIGLCRHTPAVDW